MTAGGVLARGAMSGTLYSSMPLSVPRSVRGEAIMAAPGLVANRIVQPAGVTSGDGSESRPLQDPLDKPASLASRSRAATLST